MEDALEELEKARTQRTKLVFRDGVGFVYEADQNAIKEAQDRVDELRFQAVLDKIDEAIDAFEEADKYIAEHIKPYYIKGKMLKQSDLQAKSTKLKEKYNALLPEHNAFVIKRDTAHKYTRQVRNYLQNKEQQERNRQYQEKKRSQQRKTIWNNERKIL